ncbi:MAG: isocitrate/isopropylmalate family dehydrogenase [Eubacteriales bacterium]|nr:isocitrate/isopropylmalate family dehydrogenase [Eubacteriales bacterium]
MDQINDVCAQFRQLLMEQIDRVDKMKSDERPPKDFATLTPVTIGVCPGDGIGTIICAQTERILKALLKDEIAAGKIVVKDIEGLTIENRLAKNQAVPDDVLAEIKTCDVLLKGPTTTPKGGTMESANVALRRELDLYANVRPVKVPDQGIDWTFYRENTEGEYVLGSKGIDIPGELSMNFKVTTEPGTRRIARAAFEYAKANGKTNVAIVTKANIMKQTDGNFSRICHEVAADYPDITAEDWYIDIMTANLLKEDRRSEYQVFVLPNLYGDIITDEAAQIQGGVGTAGSANIGDQYAMFEAIHGSAPRMIENGYGDYANPSSMIKAAEMLLRHIGRTAEADRLDSAMEKCTETEKKLVVTGRPNGATAEEFTDYVLETLGE